jgi:hypothetical protein
MRYHRAGYAVRFLLHPPGGGSVRGVGGRARPDTTLDPDIRRRYPRPSHHILSRSDGPRPDPDGSIVIRRGDFLMSGADLIHPEEFERIATAFPPAHRVQRQDGVPRRQNGQQIAAHLHRRRGHHRAASLAGGNVAATDSLAPAARRILHPFHEERDAHTSPSWAADDPGRHLRRRPSLGLRGCGQRD